MSSLVADGRPNRSSGCACGWSSDRSLATRRTDGHGRPSHGRPPRLKRGRSGFSPRISIRGGSCFVGSDTPFFPGVMPDGSQEEDRKEKDDEDQNHQDDDHQVAQAQGLDHEDQAHDEGQEVGRRLSRDWITTRKAGPLLVKEPAAARSVSWYGVDRLVTRRVSERRSTRDGCATSKPKKRYVTWSSSWRHSSSRAPLCVAAIPWIPAGAGMTVRISWRTIAAFFPGFPPARE